ncbi:MAG: hypothetical protein ACXVH3_35590 [Solirubrobacteraceae bacterium]
MSARNPILRLHVPGAEPDRIGNEFFEQSLADAIRAEVEIIAQDAGAELLQ